jgi:hypothetical protein
LFGLVAVFGFVFGQAAWARGGSDSVRLVRVIETAALGHPDPVGLAFSPRADSFLILEAPGASRPPFSDIVNISHRERFAGSARFGAALSAPLNMAFDGKSDRLLVFEPGRDELIAVAAGADGFPGPDRMTQIDAGYFGVWEPRGMTVDPLSGHLFMLDGLGARILRIEPDPVLGFAQATIGEIGFEPAGLAGFELRGIALDPTTGHLHVLSPERQRLYEVTKAGLVVANRDLSGIGLADPQAIVFAPSGDMTDDPLEMSLYIADGGGPAISGRARGGIIELSLTAPPAQWQIR